MSEIRPARILSIDGGGILGIIPASTLIALEQQMASPFACFSLLRQSIPAPGIFDFTVANTRVVSLGTGFFPVGNTVPKGFLGWLGRTLEALLDAPEDQQTELVNRHFPGIL
jgi:hypothetical protein